MREGIAVAGVSLDTPESHREWSERLRLPYPLLSDPERSVGQELGLVRRVGIGEWTVDFFRRTTLLADEAGVVQVVWSRIKVRGHAAEVLVAARAMRALG